MPIGSSSLNGFVAAVATPAFTMMRLEAPEPVLDVVESRPVVMGATGMIPKILRSGGHLAALLDIPPLAEWEWLRESSNLLPVLVPILAGSAAAGILYGLWLVKYRPSSAPMSPPSPPPPVKRSGGPEVFVVPHLPDALECRIVEKWEWSSLMSNDFIHSALYSNLIELQIRLLLPESWPSRPYAALVRRVAKTVHEDMKRMFTPELSDRYREQWQQHGFVIRGAVPESLILAHLERIGLGERVVEDFIRRRELGERLAGLREDSSGEATLRLAEILRRAGRL
jgi:hypothetical protein